MTIATLEGKTLLAAPKDRDAPASATMVAVARKYWLSPATQLREILSLRFGPGKIALAEYFANGLFDPELSPDAKREFVGRAGSREINDWLSPEGLTQARAILRDKVMHAALLQRLGLPTTETQAVAVAGRSFGSIPALRGPAELRDFLLERAEFPVFGKPRLGAASVGSVLLTGVEDDQIVLGNGRRAGLDDFCAGIFAGYPEGFILQSALVQHPDLARVIGAPVGPLRVVTLRDGDAPRALYTVWEIAAPRATSDKSLHAGRMVAAVNGDGRVGRCRRGTGLDGHWIDAHPLTGERFGSVRIPHWRDLNRVACEAHALFPEFGILGWDMAMTPDGPTIVAADDDPFHVRWQLANGRGIRNAEFMPAFRAAADRSQAMLAGLAQTDRERRRARRGRH